MERLDVSRLPLWVPRAFEEQVIQHEREIECRVAEPRTLGIDDHRAGGSAQDILRAEVAVNQRAFGVPRGLDQFPQPGRQLRACPSCRDQIGLEPDVVKDVVGREARGDIVAISGRRVNAAQRVADPGRLRRGYGSGREQHLPCWIAVGRKIFHGETTRLAVFAQDARRRRRRDRTGHSHPFGFPSIAADGRQPVRRDLELGQRPFDAKRDAGGQVDAIDVGRNAPLERCDQNSTVSAY